MFSVFFHIFYVISKLFSRQVLASYYIFGGIIGALGGRADSVGGHASLLLLTNRCLGGALSGALFADGILEA